MTSQASLPALLLLSYVVGGALLYGLFGARGYRDEEIAGRHTGVTTKAVRVFFSWLVSPWLQLLLWAEIPASAVTRVSLAFSLAAAVALGAGHFSLGGVLFLLASVCDYFDGRLARAQGGGTPQGAALDSIVDRYSEAALLTGLCWYYRQSWVLLPALFALSGSLLVPYARAKAEALGINVSEVGWLQRPERAIILGASTGLAPLADGFFDAILPREAGLHGLTAVGICVLAFGTQVSAWKRNLRLLELLANGTETPHRGARAIASSAVATALDAALVASLSWVFSQSLPLATVAGCLLGASVNFALNRGWAFDASDGKLGRQGKRYVVTSLSSALLNAGGVALMTLLPEVPDAASWLLVRGVIFATWTFPLYGEYVFQNHLVPVHRRAMDRRETAASRPTSAERGLPS